MHAAVLGKLDMVLSALRPTQKALEDSQTRTSAAESMAAMGCDT